MRKYLVVVALMLLFSLSFSAVAVAGTTAEPSIKTNYPGSSISPWLPGSNYAMPIVAPLRMILPSAISVVVGRVINSAPTYDMSPGEYNGQKGHWTRYGEFIPARS